MCFLQHCIVTDRDRMVNPVKFRCQLRVSVLYYIRGFGQRERSFDQQQNKHPVIDSYTVSNVRVSINVYLEFLQRVTRNFNEPITHYPAGNFRICVVEVHIAYCSPFTIMIDFK